MEAARPVGWAFFPLDEELGLLSGGLTPRGEELLARLASWMPIRASTGVAGGPGGSAGEQGNGAPRDTGDRNGGAGGVGGRGGAPQAGGAPSACRSGQTSDEWGWSLCALGGG